MNFNEVKEFLKSWGMYPCEEDTDNYNPRVIEQGINAGCYSKMIKEARNLYGESFANFVSAMVNATDDAFYLDLNTWSQLENIWSDWRFHDDGNYFAIVWGGSKFYYLCDSEKMVQERLDLVMNDPVLNKHIYVLKPSREFKNGKEVK